mgnify:CR=1 FL=1
MYKKQFMILYCEIIYFHENSYIFFGENDIFRPQEFVNLVVDHCIQYLKYILILELYSQLSTPMNPQWM